MLIQKKLGTIYTLTIGNRVLDTVVLEWFETNKRIMHKRSSFGMELVMKFLNEDPGLRQDDVIFENETSVVMIEIAPCDAIVVQPDTMYAMASLCYEIGNKHLPLFWEVNEVLVPFEAPLFRLLEGSGFNPQKQHRKLLHPIKSSVSPHNHTGSKSLFSKILQLTNAAPDV